MSLCDLSKRTTENWEEYNKYIKSSDSLLYVEDGILLKDSGPLTLNITVGDHWYKSGKPCVIPEHGLKLKPGDSVLLETRQKFAMPNNLYGIIYGTGKNIFRGGFISTGKINPGFSGYLKIGYYNGNKSTITFKPDDLLACCSFFDCETTLTTRLANYIIAPEPELENGKLYALKRWFLSNWYSVLSSLVAIAAIIISILKP